MSNTMKSKKIVIAGDTLEEVKADLAAVEALMRSGHTCGCGGQTLQAATEGHAAMAEVHGWAYGGSVEPDYTVTGAPSEEEDERPWDECFYDNFNVEAKELVKTILSAVEELDEPEVLAKALVGCATDLLCAALEHSAEEISRGEMIDRMIHSADDLWESLENAC